MNTARMHLTFAEQAGSSLAIARATLVHLGREIWRALEAHGRNRATRTLLEFADGCERTAPEAALELRAACRWLQECRPGEPQG